MNRDIIEAAARALRDKVGSATFAGRSNLLPLSLDDLAEAVLAAVTPLIRAAALEQAAKVAEDKAEKLDSNEAWGAAVDIATAIRNLKRQP